MEVFYIGHRIHNVDCSSYNKYDVSIVQEGYNVIIVQTFFNVLKLFLQWTIAIHVIDIVAQEHRYWEVLHKNKDTSKVLYYEFSLIA